MRVTFEIDPYLIILVFILCKLHSTNLQEIIVQFLYWTIHQDNSSMKKIKDGRD